MKLKKQSIIILSALVMILSGFKIINGEKKDSPLVNWTDIEQAQALTKENPKNVFIDFTAKWCGWCKVMDKKTFSDPAVAKYMNENYYSVKMDFDSDKIFNYLGKEYTAKQLAKKYGVTGLPTMLLASSDFGNVIQIVGFQKAGPFMKKLKQFNE